MMRAGTLRKLAWVYAAGFLGVFLVTHTPGLSDVEGRLFGLFKIDPIDDVAHLLSGLAGALVAGWATRHLSLYFKVIGVAYGLDVVVGMALSRGFLDLSVFTQGPGAADLSLRNFLLNAPHIPISVIALVAGFCRPASQHAAP